MQGEHLMDWLRLWHDMPNDPKWRTIARNCGESVSLVIATYLHMLVDASRNVTRGHVTVTKEDLASALDVTEAQISAIFSAMEGRVIDDGHLLGWEKRQPKREDSGNPETGAKSAAQRQAEARERKRLARLNAETPSNVTHSHAQSRNVTTEEIRLEEIRGEGEGERVTPTAPVDNSQPPPIPLEFMEVMKSRADLDPNTVWTNFHTHYPADKRTLARWTKWVVTEHGPAKTTTNKAPASVSDPDSRASIEARAIAQGMGKWNESGEQWSVYKARVLGISPAPANRQSWNQTLASKGIAHAAQ
jgi:hypothetical protein